MLIAGRTLRRFVRTPALLVATFGFPVLQLFMLLAAFSALVGQTMQEDYVRRLAPFIVLATAFSSMGSSGISFWMDIRSGILTRLQTMPLNAASVLLGRILGDLVRIVVIAVLVALIALIPGFRFQRGPAAAAAFFGVVLLFGTMCTAISLTTALVSPNPGAIMRRLQLPTLVLSFLSSGYMPLAAFPEVSQPFVRANPLSIANTTLIGLSAGGPVLVSLLETAGWALGVSAACVIVMIRRFRSVAWT